MLEPISKMRLRAHGGVANRLKMLTYYRICSEQRLLSRSAPYPDEHIYLLNQDVKSRFSGEL
jgi:hypothetical protein